MGDDVVHRRTFPRTIRHGPGAGPIRETPRPPLRQARGLTTTRTRQTLAANHDPREQVFATPHLGETVHFYVAAGIAGENQLATLQDERQDMVREIGTIRIRSNGCHGKPPRLALAVSDTAPAMSVKSSVVQARRTVHLLFLSPNVSPTYLAHELEIV